MSTQDRANDWPPPPLPNTYWVLPGRLLAGEYPGTTARKETRTRLMQLARAGVRTFIDLTQAGELTPYAEHFPEVEPAIEHRRFGILDHGVPTSIDALLPVLAAIDTALAAGRGVYVHCRAGIGRTGTTMGCYLIHRGMTSEQAIKELQTLWRQCARSRLWPSVPETYEQTEFVRRFRAVAVAPAAPTLDRCRGAWLGLGIGNALGAQPTLGASDPLGTLTRASEGADTAMALCVAESLLTVGDHDADDQMQRYLQWMRTGTADTVPEPVRKAVANWQFSRKARGGSHDPKNRDPHSLARTLAVALFWRSDPERAIAMAAEVSATTQQAPVVLDACRLLVALLIDALAGVPKDGLLAGAGVAGGLVIGKLRPEAASLLSSPRQRGEASRRAGADVLGVLAAVLSVLEHAATFTEGVARAIEATSVPAISGAVYGALAGAHYGAPALDADWCAALARASELRDVANRLFAATPRG